MKLEWGSIIGESLYSIYYDEKKDKSRVMFKKGNPGEVVASIPPKILTDSSKEVLKINEDFMLSIYEGRLTRTYRICDRLNLKLGNVPTDLEELEKMEYIRRTSYDKVPWVVNPYEEILEHIPKDQEVYIVTPQGDNKISLKKNLGVKDRGDLRRYVKLELVPIHTTRRNYLK